MAASNLAALGVGKGGGSADIVSTYVTVTEDSTTQTTYTINSSLGTASGHRIVGVMARGSAARTVSSVTVDGVAADLTSTFNNGGNNTLCFAACAASGNTTGDVVVVFSGNCACCLVAIWHVANLTSTTATATATDASLTGAVLSTGISVSAGGGVFALVFSNDATSSPGSWSGVTERFDQTADGAIRAVTGASLDFAAASTPTAQATLGGTGGSPILLAAAYR